MQLFFAARSNRFEGFAILSPITYPCKKINQTLIFSQKKNYKVYISTEHLDAENYTENLFPILQSKTTRIKLVKTEGGHDYKNWNSQMFNIFTFMKN